MKKILTCLFFILCFTTRLVFAQGEVVDTPQQTPQKQVMTQKRYECGYQRPLRVAAGMMGNAPFAWEEYRDAGHTKFQSFGLGLKIIDNLSKKMGFRYESTGFPNNEEAIRALKAGEIDILFTAYHRPLGMGTKIMYPSYFTNIFQVYVKKGSEPQKSLAQIQNYKDLIGWKGVVREEEQILPLITQKTKQLNLKKVLTAATVFKMLMNGEADYLIGSPYAIEAELRRQKLQDDIVPVGGVLDQAGLFFVFSTKSNCTQMLRDFEKTFKENPPSNEQIEDILYQIIDEWGNRFREGKGILEKDTETLEKTE